VLGLGESTGSLDVQLPRGAQRLEQGLQGVQSPDYLTTYLGN
jgi:hypothetical protein